MELVRYWRIIKRRLWLVAVLLAVVLASYPFSASRPPASYNASMRFAVGLQPEPRSGAYYTYDYYYTWLTAEYLVDDWPRWCAAASLLKTWRPPPASP